MLEMIRAFEAASGISVPYQIVDRRPGDAPESFADASKAAAELGWQAQYDLQRMCEDAWRWQASHPDGFNA